MKNIITPRHLGGHKNITHTDEGVAKYLINQFDIKTVIDIGCGPGGMLPIWEANGAHAVGIDGDPAVAINNDKIILHDFTKSPLNTSRTFDLAWSVEFLEHVEEKYQSNYMSLFSRCRYVMITAAPPGKKGYHHVNCKDEKYWIDVFENYNFSYDGLTTGEIVVVSTMKREFIRNNALFFINNNTALFD